MSQTRSEYQVEYCGMKSKAKGGGSGGGAGGEGPEGLTPCKNNEDVQPVGGRVQAKYRDEINQQRDELAQTMGGGGGTTQHDPAQPGEGGGEDEEYIPLGHSVYDEDYTNEMNLQNAKGLKPPGGGGSQAREPYIPPPFQPDLYMFRSSEIKAPNLPFVPASMRQ